MFSTSSHSATSTQVVPQLGSDVSSSHGGDEPTLTLTNPSPMAGMKGFDFLFNPSPFDARKFELPPPSSSAAELAAAAAAAAPASSGPSGLMTPNTSILMSLFQATPQPASASNGSPFVFSNPAAAAAAAHDQVTVPISAPAAAMPTPLARATTFQQQQQQQQQHQQQQQQLALQQQQQQKRAHLRAAREQEEEEHEETSHASHAASEDEDVDDDEELAMDEEHGSDSEASFSPRQQSHHHQQQSGGRGGKGRKRKAAQPIAGSAATFDELTDDQIAFMDFKELMRLMVAAGMTRQGIADTKARRRRLKNRQSARLCSNKKRELCSDLSSKNQQLHDTIERLQREVERLKKENTLLKQQIR